MPEYANAASFQDHCRALGELCITWAFLDRKLTDLASVLVNRGPEVAACIFPGGENLKPRCESIKKLVLIDPILADSEWPARLTEIVNHVQRDVAPRRNRYIHDEWFVAEDRVMRVQLDGRIHKEPFQPAKLRYAEFHQSSTPEVDTLTREVGALTERLTYIVILITNARLLGQPPEPFWQ